MNTEPIEHTRIRVQHSREKSSFFFHPRLSEQKVEKLLWQSGVAAAKPPQPRASRERPPPRRQRCHAASQVRAPPPPHCDCVARDSWRPPLPDHHERCCCRCAMDARPPRWSYCGRDVSFVAAAETTTGRRASLGSSPRAGEASR